MVQEQDDLQVSDTYEMVTSVGNAWIIRKSKSHPGRTYYFNTLTGQAVWNLSPGDIEKAEQRTKAYEKHPAQLMESCPEPMEPPGEQMLQEVSHVDSGQSSATVTAQEMLEENIINSQFTKRSFTMTPMMNPQCSSAIFCHPLAHTMNQLSFNVAPQFNPHIWAFPPTHQIYISPNTRNQTQTSLDIAFNNLDGNISVSNTSQNTSIPLSKRFKLMNNMKEFKQVNRRRRSQDKRLQYQHGEFLNRHFNNTDEIKDLRQVLSAKRRERKYSQSKNNEELDTTKQNDSVEEIEQTQLNDIQVLPMKNEITTEVGVCCENGDNEKDIDQLKRKSLCTANLKKLASPNTITSCWYIVTDSGVLLNNLDFISELMSSDQKCCLLVRRSVMTELRDGTRGDTSRIMTNSRRAIRFFSEQQKNGCAKIDEDAENESNFNEQSQILRTGLKVADRKYFVVIISDNEDIQNRKNFVNIPIFTVQQFKDFLACDAIENVEQIFEHRITIEPKQTKVVTITTEIPPKEDELNVSEQANSVATTSTLPTKAFQTNKPKQVSIDAMTTGLATNEIQMNKTIKTMSTDLPTTPIQTNALQQENIVEMSAEVLCKEITMSKPIQKKTIEPVTEDIQTNKPKLVNTVGTTTDLLTKTVQTDLVEIPIPISKKTVDASVQTDDSSLQPKLKNNQIDVAPTTHVDKIIQTYSTSAEPEDFEADNPDGGIAAHNDTTKFDATSKKKEIRLKRSISNKTTSSNTVVEENIDKKHFKWRRRKFTVNNQNVDIKLPTNNEPSGSNSKSTSQTGVSDDSGYKNNDGFNFDKILPIHASNESLNKQSNAQNVFYDDNLESDAGSCINKLRNSRDKIVIEETSTSGIISNTASNVDSDSVYSICQRLSRNFSGNESKQDDRSISFEVADRNVEEYLRMRSDEVVSRFVQIMEEALTQVLIRYQPMLDTVPPPWTIREAVECIIQKFGDDHNVMDAANCLHNTLNKISDEKGKISIDVTPAEYMEMFTYGAYMIETLKKVNDCEDLQMAAESLSKLLCEILDPNSDANQNAFSFLDSTHETAANNLYSTTEEQFKDPGNSGVQKTYYSTMTPNQTPEGNFKRQKYNLRSNRKNDEHTESTFFSSLELQKKESHKDHYSLSKLKDKPIVTNYASSDNQLDCNDIRTISTKDPIPETKISASKATAGPKITRKFTNIPNMNLSYKNIKSAENGIYGDIEEKNHKVAGDAPKNVDKNVNYDVDSNNSGSKAVIYNKETEKVNEPKIIRNFTKCLEFEEKLKLKYRQPLDLDQLDYSDYEEDDDYNFDFTHNLPLNSYEEAIAEKETDKRDFNDDQNNNIDFNIIFAKILNEIKETFTVTKRFCENSYKVLSEWETLNSKNRNEYHEKALGVHSNMSRICAILDSITDRNVETIVNIKNLLGNIGIDNLKDEVFMRYRDTMIECKNEGNILLETVDIILNGIK